MLPDLQFVSLSNLALPDKRVSIQDHIQLQSGVRGHRDHACTFLFNHIQSRVYDLLSSRLHGLMIALHYIEQTEVGVEVKVVL